MTDTEADSRGADDAANDPVFRILPVFHNAIEQLRKPQHRLIPPANNPSLSIRLALAVSASAALVSFSISSNFSMCF